AIEDTWREEHDEDPSAVEIALTLLQQLSDLHPVLAAAVRYLDLPREVDLAQRISEPALSALIDGDMELEVAAAVAPEAHVETDEAARSIVRLSIVSHILRPELVSMMSSCAGEDALMPPPFEARPSLASCEDALKDHFERLKLNGLAAERRLTEANLRLVVSV